MAKWIEDPQGREEVEKVTEILKLPVWKANAKGKFRDFWNEVWDKIEDNFLKLTKKNEDNYTEFTDKIIGLAGKQNGKFPLNSATKGNVYLLEQTQKFYVCTQNYSGTTISVPNANFTELSVWENMNRLESLITNDSYSFKIGNLIIQGGYGVSRTEYINFPKPFPNSCITVIPTPTGSGLLESNNDSFVIDDSLSYEDRKKKFKVMVKGSTTQIRLNYIAIGY